MFEIGQTNTDIVELYFDDQVQVVSDLTKFSDRAIKDPKPIFKMPIKPGQTKEVYIKVKGQDELVIPIHVSSTQTIQSKGQVRETLFGLFAGILAVMILYNLFLFLSLRTSIYFFYVINILPLFIGQSSLVGYANKFFWPNSNFWPDHAVVIFPLLSIIFRTDIHVAFYQSKTTHALVHLGHQCIYSSQCDWYWLFINWPNSNSLYYSKRQWHGVGAGHYYHLCCINEKESKLSQVRFGCLDHLFNWGDTLCHA